MPSFIFLSEEGMTFQPNAVLATQNVLRNPQVLGIAEGVNAGNAFLNLVRHDRSLLDTRFDEVVCLELASTERRLLYLHDLRPSDEDTEAKAIFKNHLVTSEPVSEDEVDLLLAAGLGSPEDYEHRGGGCFWFGPAFPEPEDPE